MKSSQTTTAEPAVPTLGTIGTWAMSLLHLHLRLAPHFARPEVRQHALLYLRAILSEIPRKNGWQIAEHAREERPYGMQRLLSRAVWDQEGCRDELRALVRQALSPPPLVPASAEHEPLYPVLVLDESGFPKRGRHWAGVAPQYCGVSGRVENCQVGVFLSYVTERGHALIDRELYLPDDWCTDLPRRRAAHIPDTLSFATKPELAKRMVQRTQAAGLPIRWVVADTVYGHSSDLRNWLEEQGYAHALAVPSTEVVCVQTRAGLLLADVASIAQRALRAQDWQRLSARQGTKGERRFDWARLPLVHRGEVDGRHWLVFRRCLDDPHELAYYLVWAPADTPLSTMVRAIGARWHIEEDLEVSKDLGLDQYEVRSYLGWYRHITLVLLAYAFLVSICVQATRPLPAQALIALTPQKCGICWPASSGPLPLQRCSSVSGRGGAEPINIGPAIPIVAAARKPTKPLSRTPGLFLPQESCPLLPGTVLGVLLGVLLARFPTLFPDKPPGKTPGTLPEGLLFWLSVPHERSCSLPFVSLAQAASSLGIDVKTLHRWLADAQLPLHSHPHDGRKKGVSSEHLQALARLHQRSLAPLPQQSPAPEASQEPELSAALLALPETLCALQAQIAALQQQVADLTRLITQHGPGPAIPLAPTKPPSTAKRPAKPTPPAPRSRRAAKPPSKSAHVIPRVEYGPEGRDVVICPKQGLLPLEPDTPEWFAWLAAQSSFRFVGKLGRFTAHHEWRVPRGAWRAHRQIRNHSYTLRLAPTHDLTMAVLEQTAEALQAHLT